MIWAIIIPLLIVAVGFVAFLVMIAVAPGDNQHEDARPTIKRDDYLSREDEAAYLALDEDGLPNVRLRGHSGRMVLELPQGIVNPRSTSLYKTGIFTFKIRGTSYHERAYRVADLSAGAQVQLKREPDNLHDPNAVAITSATSDSRVGYVNKLNAKRLAKMIDAGVELVAHSIDGPGRGSDDLVATILVTTPAIWIHITR